MKYRIYVYIGGPGCGSCDKDKKWLYFGVTHNPEQFKAEHPGLIVKIEKAILS